MISVRSRNRLLTTRPKGLNASPESRAVVLDERRRNYLLPTGRLSSQESVTCPTKSGCAAWLSAIEGIDVLLSPE